MTEPIITLSNSADMINTGIASGDLTMHYLLYADDYAFNDWTDWVNDSVNSPT